MPKQAGNDLDLGLLPGGKAKLLFPKELRDKHLYICGSTGVGKTKMLESLIRQDIKQWNKSKCGLIVLDPHGSLYDNLIEWLAWNSDLIKAPIIPIDLRQDDWIVSYNLLRHREIADPSVLVDNVIDAMAYVWGQSGTNQTPLFARWAGNVVHALYEKKLTLIEAEHLLDRVEKQTRYAMTSDLQDRSSRQDWAFADTLSAKDFETQIGSTVSRLRRFITNTTMRATFGQPEVSIDFGRAIDEGSIILVNLATERARVSGENANLFATLLMSDLWTAAQERGKRDGIKPFYLYLDEFQRFVTPTIAENLDEARGFGLHLTMANQFPYQLVDQGESGRRVFNSIMENASSKIVFRLSHEDNLKAMAQWLYRGVMDPDEIKHELYSTKVMEYREQLQETFSEGGSSGRTEGRQSGRARGAGSGGTRQFFEDEDTLHRSESSSRFASDSESYNDISSEGKAWSKSVGSVLVPVMGKELSHVQFRSLDEQLFRGMAVLFDQQERNGVARLVGMKAPVSIRTPTIQKTIATKERTQRFLNSSYEKLPFALPATKAHQLVKERADTFAATLLNQSASEEPTSAKRKIS